MIIDSKLAFCTALDVSAGAAGTATVGDQIDLDTVGRRLGSGQPMEFTIQVSTDFASAGAATVQFRIVSDSVAPAATDGTETVHVASDVFSYTELTKGKRIILRMPGGTPAFERYLALQVVTGTAATTAGAISAALVMDAQDWEAMPDASN